MWYGGYYEVSQEEKCRVIQSQDEEGFTLISEDNRTRHLVVRNGFYLMIPFQCKLGHFRNLKGVEPIQRRDNILLTRAIRRTNVHAF